MTGGTKVMYLTGLSGPECFWLPVLALIEGVVSPDPYKVLGEGAKRLQGVARDRPIKVKLFLV